MASAVKTKSDIGHKTMAFDRERVEGLFYSGPMEFYMEIAAHRVGGPETLGLSELQIIKRMGHRTFNCNTIAKITTDNTAMKNARGKITFCKLRALFRIRNIDSFRPLPFLCWTRRREDLSEVLSRINWNSRGVNSPEGRDKAT